MISPELSPTWLTAGAVSAASRFVPLPFVDDLLKERSERYIVGRALRDAGFGYPLDEVEPLYSDDGGGSGITGMALSLARRLLLFPIRRLVRFATAVTGVPRDALRPLLLGRAVNRAIARGRLSPATPADIRAAEARRIRSAFEAAFDGINRRLLRAALAELTRAARGGAPGTESLQALARDFDRRLEAELEAEPSRGG